MSRRDEIPDPLARRFGPFEDVRRLAADASVRSFHRVRRPGGATAVLLEDRDGGRAAIERMIAAQRLLAGLGVPVPALIDADPGMAAVLLEDFGDRLLADAAREIPRPRLLSAYRNAARIAARIAVDGTPLVSGEHPLAERPLGRARLRDELEFFVVHDVKGRRGVEDTALLARLGESLDGIADELGRHGSRLAHRDFHARNILLLDGDRLGVVDFQDTLLAPPLYDLASLVFDPYVDTDPELRREAAEGYRRVAGLAEDPLEDPLFPWVAAQRLLKALGTYAHQVFHRGNDRFAPAAERAERSAFLVAGRIPGETGRALRRSMAELGFPG